MNRSACVRMENLWLPIGSGDKRDKFKLWLKATVNGSGRCPIGRRMSIGPRARSNTARKAQAWTFVLVKASPERHNSRWALSSCPWVIAITLNSPHSHHLHFSSLLILLIHLENRTLVIDTDYCTVSNGNIRHDRWFGTNVLNLHERAALVPVS